MKASCSFWKGNRKARINGRVCQPYMIPEPANAFCLWRWFFNRFSHGQNPSSHILGLHEFPQWKHTLSCIVHGNGIPLWDFSPKLGLQHCMRVVQHPVWESHFSGLGGQGLFMVSRGITFSILQGSGSCSPFSKGGWVMFSILYIGGDDVLHSPQVGGVMFSKLWSGVGGGCRTHSDSALLLVFSDASEQIRCGVRGDSVDLRHRRLVSRALCCCKTTDCFRHGRGRLLLCFQWVYLYHYLVQTPKKTPPFCSSKWYWSATSVLTADM